MFDCQAPVQGQILLQVKTITHHVHNQLRCTCTLQVRQTREQGLLEGVKRAILEASQRQNTSLAVIQQEELRDTRTATDVRGGCQPSGEGDIRGRRRVEHHVERRLTGTRLRRVHACGHLAELVHCGHDRIGALERVRRVVQVDAVGAVDGYAVVLAEGGGVGPWDCSPDAGTVWKLIKQLAG